MNTTTATTTGNQPPSAIFNRLALKKVRSMMPKAAKTGTATARLQPPLRMYRKASPVVMAIMPLTAMP